MFGSFLGSLGGKIGSHFGGGILSTIGRYAGRMAGNYLDQKIFHKIEHSYHYQNIKDAFGISCANYGTPIPLIFGQMKITGQIIWANDIKVNRIDSESKKYFRQSGYVKSVRHDTELEYQLSFAVAICEGPIIDIARIWFGDELIDISKYNFRIYYGGEQQMPDPLINQQMNGNAPAYRDLAYIVFENLPLADFDDRVPIFSFEVTRKAIAPQVEMLEDLVTSMIMIPGSGEYVYDTNIQSKTKQDHHGNPIITKIINAHNIHKTADAVQSLNQLQRVCTNVEWVSPVACWFGDNLNIQNCQIRPAVEFKDENMKYSEEWRIGNYNRDNAYEISKDELGNPTYGGSINDASIIRYLTELKQRRLKIMFYPMVFMDISQKPWRGRLSGSPEDIHNFFHKPTGYNQFILHYANLVKNHVDAFVIGSEFIGLTKIKQGARFPAVDELVNLAKLVKQIVGSNVLVTYAADWSEYHHTEGGWYNLDPLWSSPDIDFIGIDAYFPVSNSHSSIISDEELVEGLKGGEGYDYYIDHSNGTKHSLSPAYAWKNIAYWWNNKHTNPDGTITNWHPQSKKIWFTEFGFPSIDKAPNQPNVFFDPCCLDGGVPRYSNGEIDFSIQRRSIKAFLKYWGSQEYIGQMFLWTWDARPYPAWPHMDIWRDGYLWEKGHWVNNKFGASNLSAIIAEISARSAIDNISKLQLQHVDETVDGLIFTNQIIAMNALNLLRVAYFFDIDASLEDKIAFVKRGRNTAIDIYSHECLKISDNSLFTQIEIPSELIITELDLYSIDKFADYQIYYNYINNDTDSATTREIIKLPLILSQSESERIGQLILQNAKIEDRIINLILDFTYAKLQPCDFINFYHNNKIYHLRILEVKIINLKVYIVAIIDNLNIYNQNIQQEHNMNLQFQNIEIDYFNILDLPFYIKDIKNPYLAIFIQSNLPVTLFAKLKDDNDLAFQKLITLNSSDYIFKITNYEILDEIMKIQVRSKKADINITFLNNVNQIAMIEKEIIEFSTIIKLENYLYEITIIARRKFHTGALNLENIINQDFIILSEGANIIPISAQLENKDLIFKVEDKLMEIHFQNLAKKETGVN